MSGQTMYPVPSRMSQREQRALGARLELVRKSVFRPFALRSTPEDNAPSISQLRYFYMNWQKGTLLGKKCGIPVPCYSIGDACRFFRPEIDPSVLIGMEQGYFPPNVLDGARAKLMHMDHHNAAITILAKFYGVDEEALYYGSGIEDIKPTLEPEEAEAILGNSEKRSVVWGKLHRASQPWDEAFFARVYVS